MTPGPGPVATDPPAAPGSSPPDLPQLTKPPSALAPSPSKSVDPPNDPKNPGDPSGTGGSGSNGPGNSGSTEFEPSGGDGARHNGDDAAADPGAGDNGDPGSGAPGHGSASFQDPPTTPKGSENAKLPPVSASGGSQEHADVAENAPIAPSKAGEAPDHSGVVVQLDRGSDPITAVVRQKGIEPPVAIMEGATINPGADPVTLSHATVSFASGGNFIAIANSRDGRTIKAAVSILPQPASGIAQHAGSIVAQAAPLIGPQTIVLSPITPGSPLQTIVATPTWTEGPNGKMTRIVAVADYKISADSGLATISGHIISLASNGGFMVDGTLVRPITGSEHINSGLLRGMSIHRTSIVGSDGRTTSADIVAGMTLAAGGPVATISGYTVSLASNGELIVDGQTLPAANINSAPAMATTAVTVTDGSGPHGIPLRQTTIVGADGKTKAMDIVGDVTITPGGIATINGHIFTLASDGALAVDGKFMSPTNVAASPITAVTISDASGPHTLPLRQKTVVGSDGRTTTIDAVNGVTMTPGAMVSIHGHMFSMLSDGQLVEDDTQTIFLSTDPASTTSAPSSSVAATGLIELDDSETNASGARASLQSSSASRFQCPTIWSVGAPWVTMLLALRKY